MPDSLEDWAEFAANVVVFFGAIWALYQYRDSLRKRTEDYDQHLYDTLAREYREWLDFCIAHPELKVGDWDFAESTEAHKLTRNEAFALTKLTSMFEHAYVLYHAKETEFRKRQLSGWEDYIRWYASKEIYRDFWKNGGGSQFDQKFMEYMVKEIGLPAPGAHIGGVALAESPSTGTR